MKRLGFAFLLVMSTGFAAAGTEDLKMISMLQITKDNANLIPASKKPMIIDVQASWCPSCQRMEPIMDELSEEYEGKIVFATIDIDQDRALADQYGVTNLPTILFIKPRQKTPVMKSVGFMSKEDFKAKINEFISKS